MNIKVDYFDNEIKLSNDLVYSIEIENKKYFYRFVQDLYKMINENYSDTIGFYDDNYTEISMKDNLQIVTDFFNFSFNNKKNINDITKYVKEKFNEDDIQKIILQYKKIKSTYENVLNDIDLPLKLSQDINIDDITKLMKITVNFCNNLLDNILLLIDIEKNFAPNAILVFINLKSYLAPEDLIELYKYSIYNQIKIILVDSVSYGVTLKNERKLIIDDSLVEFML